MFTTWDLNPIVLSHTNRFFAAASRVLRQRGDTDQELLGALFTLSGNMRWARSSFEAADREEEQAMAYSGAFISSLADRAVQGLLGGAGGALEALDELERQVRGSHDAICQVLARELERREQAPATPGQLNDWVWRRLFPGVEPGLSQAELEEQVRLRLERAAA